MLSNRSWKCCLLLALYCGSCAAPPRIYTGQSRLEKLTMEPNQVLQADAQECGLTLEGPFGQLQLRGRENHVHCTGAVDRLDVDGQGNSIDCEAMPRQIRLRGSGNVISIAEGPQDKRPEVDVKGNDQAINFRPQAQAPHR